MPGVRFCRGPLVLDSTSGVTFCAPDADIPWRASGLRAIPLIRPIPPAKSTGGLVVYLEGQRAASDVVLAQLESLDRDVIVQGDPDAPNRSTAPAICAALRREPALPWRPAHMTYFATLTQALEHLCGDWHILASCRDSAIMVHEHLRGSSTTVHAGDAVYHIPSKTRCRVVEPPSAVVGKGTSCRLLLDTGKWVPSKLVSPQVVSTPATLGSGECDTLIILPDVPQCHARPAMQRVRHLIIGIGWHPVAYLSAEDDA